MLPARTLSRVRRVCRNWNEAARGLGKLSTSEMGISATRDANKLVTSLPTAFNRLNALSLSLAMTLNDDGLVPIGKLTSLKELDLSHRTLITDKGIAHLIHIPWLMSLNLKGCHRLSNDSLATIARFTMLTQLDLSLVPRITSEGLAQLASLKNLQDLRITGCRLVRTEGIVSLSTLPLRVLDVRATGVELTRVELIAVFPDLKSVAVAADTNLVVALT